VKLAESTLESSGILSLLDLASSSSIHLHVVIGAFVTIVPSAAIIAPSALVVRYLVIISLLLYVFLDLLVIDITTTVFYNFIHSILDMGRQIVHVAIGLVHLVNEPVVLSFLFLGKRRLVLGARTHITARTALPWPVALNLRRFQVTLFLIGISRKMLPVEVILLVLFLVWVSLVRSRTVLLVLKLLLLLPCWHHVCCVISPNVHVVSLSDAHASLLLD
jgi:hypothetical protein